MSFSEKIIFSYFFTKEIFFKIGKILLKKQLKPSGPCKKNNFKIYVQSMVCLGSSMSLPGDFRRKIFLKFYLFQNFNKILRKKNFSFFKNRKENLNSDEMKRFFLVKLFWIILRGSAIPKAIFGNNF